MLDGDVFDTNAAPVADRADAWSAAIARAYFPLELKFKRPAAFEGTLRRAAVGDIGVSRLRSAAASYSRTRAHLQGAAEESYLVTLPRLSPVKFSQLGNSTACRPGGLLLERGDAPYRFEYGEANDLLVLKVPRAALRQRMRDPDSRCARAIDAASGAGALFSAMVEHVATARPVLSAREQATVRRQMLELLVLTLNGAAPGDDANTSMRAARIRQALDVIEARHADPSLTPSKVAEICKISRRYLHELFQGSEASVSKRIRDRRLRAARDDLLLLDGSSVASIAYRYGFADHAQFSRQFRKSFNVSPTEFRQSARNGVE